MIHGFSTLVLKGTTCNTMFFDCSLGCLGRSLTPCRIRHVKCDEEKPACYQCRKTGRVCDGYAQIKGKAATQHSSDPPAYPESNLALTRLDHGLLGSNQERRCFGRFKCEIGMEIMHALNTFHTQQLILQASHSNDAIQHAVVALGSLGEHLVKSRTLIVQSARNDETLSFARSQYWKAIRHLQDSVSSINVGSLELVLACCLLLMFFDFLSGDDMNGQVHLKAGLGIINRCYSQNVRDAIRQPVSEIHNSHPLVYDLFRIFSVMDLHTAIWLGRSSSHSPPLISPQMMMAPSGEALTLDGISSQLNYQLMRAYFFRSSSAISESDPIDFIAPFHVVAEKQRLLFELQQWPSILGQFLSRTELTESMDRRISLMKMNYFSTLIGLSTFLPTSPIETLTALTPSFYQITMEAKKILQPASPANRKALLLAVGENAGELDPNSIPLFAFVAGAIQPVYFTAVKCGDLKMCEMAVSMLEEVPWREGAWNSAVMANIARRQMRDKFS